MPTPGPLDADELRDELIRTRSLWRVVDVVSETGSTNADLAQRARRGEEPGAVLVTDYQSAGRGRQGRTWTAPPGTSIAMSVLVRPAVPESRWSWLPLLAGLAVAEGLHSVTGVPARLKWPNDVLAGDHKICGVLAELVEGPDGPLCVIGMGINVDLAARDLPVPTATSLAVLQPDVPHGRTELIAAILAAFELWFRRFEAEPSGASLADSYRALCATIGRQVEVHLAGSLTLTGEATAVADDGRLVVRTAESDDVRVSAGDVVHVR